MGLNYATIRHLIDFSHATSSRPDRAAVTLARQGVHVHPHEIQKLKELYRGDRRIRAFLETYRWGEYAERFLKDALGFAKADSIDADDYEGSSLTYDLSNPLPQNLWGAYDLVIDGGTLEHVFNVPVAFANAMKLARIGGGVYLCAPSNNYCGHGFYQFSPELIYRIFNEANGFEIKYVRMGIAGYAGDGFTSCHRVYDVVDPKAISARVGVMSSRQAYIMCLAIRTEDRVPFTSPVLQSDYQRAWNGQQHPVERLKRFDKAIANYLPRAVHMFLHGLYQKYRLSPYNRSFYRRVW